MNLPSRWDGCEHVIPCIACRAKGYLRGIFGREDCPLCQRRGVRWNGVSIPENMILRGYSVFCGVCYHNTVPMTEAQVCAVIWQLYGHVVKVKPAPLHLLGNVKVSEVS